MIIFANLKKKFKRFFFGGLGGLGYIMDNLGGNWEYTIDAIGWLAIALVIFSLWKPNLAILGSFVFGALYKIGNYIPGISTTQKPLIKMLPYVVTIIVLIVTSIRNKKENQAPEGSDFPISEKKDKNYKTKVHGRRKSVCRV